MLKKKLETKNLNPKNLFNHLKAIRLTKNKKYYDFLSDYEKKSFDHWLLLLWLSTEDDLLDLTNLLFRNGYFDKIPSSTFYRLLIDFVPKTSKKLIWIKTKVKKKDNLLQYIAKWYSISTREAKDYLDVFLSNDSGMENLIDILDRIGLEDNEIENLLIK